MRAAGGNFAPGFVCPCGGECTMAWLVEYVGFCMLAPVRQNFLVCTESTHTIDGDDRMDLVLARYGADSRLGAVQVHPSGLPANC